jgi:hypothetical protein
MISNIIDYIFGIVPDFGGMLFSMVHYPAIKPAIEINKPDTVIFNC